MQVAGLSTTVSQAENAGSIPVTRSTKSLPAEDIRTHPPTSTEPRQRRHVPRTSRGRARESSTPVRRRTRG